MRIHADSDPDPRYWFKIFMVVYSLSQQLFQKYRPGLKLLYEIYGVCGVLEIQL
jgi:hypothetical protein